MESKTDFEVEKLRLEVEAIRSPFRYRPALWISTITALVAVMAFLAQYSLSKKEYILAETKRVQAQLDLKEKTEAALAAEARAATAEARTTAAEERLRQASKELAEADDLLVRALPTAPADLQEDIETLREKYDPTGRFPFHVPPDEG